MPASSSPKPPLDRRLRRALEHSPTGWRGPLTALASQYYAGIDPLALATRTPEALLATLSAHLELATLRPPGTPAVRLHNPEMPDDSPEPGCTVLEVVTDDMAFLVESLTLLLDSQGLAPLLVAHPVVGVRRAADGQLLAIERPHASTASEAWMNFELPRIAQPERRDALRLAVLDRLAQVRSVVADWAAMRDRLLGVAAQLEAQSSAAPPEAPESIALLRWLADEHFVFLGAHDYALHRRHGTPAMRAVPGTGLGLLGPDGGLDRRLDTDSPDSLAQDAQQWLVLSKSTVRSPVHRDAYLDCVSVKRLNSAGTVRGEWRFVGLYTSSMYNTPPKQIPLLRHKAAAVLAASGLPPEGHSARALLHVLGSFPRDEMLQASVAELGEMASGVLALQDRRRLRLFLRTDVGGRFASALLYVPRDRYRSELREHAQRLLMDALHGVTCEFHTLFADGAHARVHYAIRIQPGSVPHPDVAALEAQLTQAMLTWSDRLQSALLQAHGAAASAPLATTWAQAFPPGYQADCTPEQAVRDIAALNDRPAGIALALELSDRDGGYRLRVLGDGMPPALSDALPRLEDFGLRVLEARPYALTPAQRPEAFVLDFDLAGPTVAPAARVQERFNTALEQVFTGALESDGLNALVLSADLTWREVTLLRAITRHQLQLQIPFSQSYMQQCLRAHPRIVRALVDLHHARMDPAREAEGAGTENRLDAALDQALDGVGSLDEDRILRRYRAHIAAMLRSNYFQTDANGHPKTYLAFKVDPGALVDIPQPAPRFEVFVYAPQMEGVHLRGGHVARGGIRHSDRREDFRTEILGLMKAQTVKNAVIVPVGAKGGFVVRQTLPADRIARDAVVRAAYTTLMSGLLDLTDNRVGARVVPPPQVRRHDGDDPYLVVAADKGTANFSDLANATAAGYDFWLDDAFASGGSAGYDHKAMGITARGAWESVQRHFREIGIAHRSTPFSVVGVGDMSGDVFGNGMLRSPQIRLLAAFDHRHVFLDPDPDPGISFSERERLFRLPRSSWADYDAGLISKGGGVYPRDAKSVPVSAQVRAALGISARALSPAELIRAILRAPVDLLWNGGVGTYVKASSETHAAVGDRSNDALRVEGHELRCRVVGEGGNLGFTQRGRIEYALAGGRINTDAIDNSAGVDCSDHEVNLKILLAGRERSDGLTRPARNRLLRGMTQAVAGAVLRDNYEQALALSADSAQAAWLLDEHARLLRMLEHGGLKRDLEVLPDDAALKARAAASQGLTRPELAVLLAHAKLHLYGQLIRTDLNADPELKPQLAQYFPPAVRRRYPGAISRHPLRREILATWLANRLINRMGPTFAARVMDDTGAAADAVLRAATTATRIYALPAVWTGIESLDDTVPGAIQVELLVETRRLLERATLWLLRRPHHLEPVRTAGRAVMLRLDGGLDGWLPTADRQAIAQRVEGLTHQGVPPTLASSVARLDALHAGLHIGALAQWRTARLVPVAGVWFALADALDIPWLRSAVRELPRLHHWQRKARASLRDDLYAELANLTGQILAQPRRAADAAQRVAAWRQRAAPGLAHYSAVLAEVKSGKGVDLASLSVAVGELRVLGRR